MFHAHILFVTVFADFQRTAPLRPASVDVLMNASLSKLLEKLVDLQRAKYPAKRGRKKAPAPVGPSAPASAPVLEEPFTRKGGERGKYIKVCRVYSCFDWTT